MNNLRFKLGTTVLCNLGEAGWKLGKVIALNYREDHWPKEHIAPYQVLIEEGHQLIYVPRDEDFVCREPSTEVIRMNHRLDALASLPTAAGDAAAAFQNEANDERRTESQLDCSCADGVTGYRSGRCQCCTTCPRNWSCTEMYSEHYRCAERNDLKVTRVSVDLGKVRVGDSINVSDTELPVKSGFMQCPTLVRLPPGVRFADDGSLSGEVRFDPHRGASYDVTFVAVSTVAWENPEVGLVRLEISCVVEANSAPPDFDDGAFEFEQEGARKEAQRLLEKLYTTWELYEAGQLRHRKCCDQFCAVLKKMRELLEKHPRLDGGMWWTQLGGFHMNVHKLLENMLFECELYLGHGLTFPDARVRQMAEANLEGCYSKRLLEAARFMWMDGIQMMMDRRWVDAVSIFQLAAAKKDGWGWAVNHGDIWISEAAARLIHVAESSDQEEARLWLDEADRVLKLALERSTETFAPHDHPWAAEVRDALVEFRTMREKEQVTTEWCEAFKLRTDFWCAQVLGGAQPFPPQPRPRLADAAELIARLPGYNE